MTIPAATVPVPERVRELARGASLTPLWQNALGGLTFRTDDGRVIKHGPHDAEANMRDEAERMRWASRWTAVPEVLEQGEDDTHEWLVTAALDGMSAVDPRWLDDPATAVRAVGSGLRMLHDALPVADCPWEWGAAGRIERASVRGIRVPAELRVPPPVDRLVVCHGDACMPNTLLGDDGQPVAHVDVAALGTADRWADIAVAMMSTLWNVGPGWDDALLDAYGASPDAERIAYYQALWNAT